ncbi:MAG: MBL fold metallo-hydrolase [Firmicutes bacterium]|nr:MBL fold metallo-hydrolase [Bacillota bacterium]MCM1401880.1 MBL fold metallo-hydrolase [Bacteroides sp.]MCM1477923.1 MBL fold metallo-hydrolase [Bacteroides sp.]
MPSKQPNSSRSRRKAFNLTASLFDLDSDSVQPSASLTPPVPDVIDFEVHPSIRSYAERHAPPAPRATVDSMELDRSNFSPQRASLTFFSMGSGSSGNCIYLGDDSSGILIDAGVHADTVRDTLRSRGINPRAIKGILLTHDHTDHVKYVYALVKKRPDMAIFCTPKTLTGLLRRHSISRRVKDYHHPIYKEFAFQAGSFKVTPFDVSHDGTDNVGYFIEHGDIKLCIATDLGCITPRVDFYMRQANHIVIESNYDARMLATGPYPMHLKARIAAEHGHLDNAVTGGFLAGIASSKLRNIFLCHLSQDNNTPAVALETVRAALAAAGITDVGDASGSLAAPELPLQLSALPRLEPSAMFTLV